jgi:hypothetical protein
LDFDRIPELSFGRDRELIAFDDASHALAKMDQRKSQVDGRGTNLTGQTRKKNSKTNRKDFANPRGPAMLHAGMTCASDRRSPSWRPATQNAMNAAM